MKVGCFQCFYPFFCGVGFAFGQRQWRRNSLITKRLCGIVQLFFWRRISDAKRATAKCTKPPGCIVTGNRKGHVVIRKRIGIAKYNFQNISKELRDMKMSLKIKKRVLNCYAIPDLLSSSECWIFSTQTKAKLKRQICVYFNQCWEKTWREYVSNDEIYTYNQKENIFNYWEI